MTLTTLMLVGIVYFLVDNYGLAVKHEELKEKHSKCPPHTGEGGFTVAPGIYGGPIVFSEGQRTVVRRNVEDPEDYEVSLVKKRV